jgi:hypothetical protein
MDPPRRGGSCKAAEGEKSPVFPNARKISRLLAAVAALAVSSSGMIPPLEMTGSEMVSYIRYTVFTDVALSVCHHLKTHQSILRLWRGPSLRACMIGKELRIE